jgi:hypothetical protein
MKNDAPLVSANGRFAAVVQDDSNLVLCFATNGVADLGRAYWSVLADAAGQVAVYHNSTGQVEKLGGPPYQARMWPDGNFVLFVGDDPLNIGVPYWGSGWSFQGHPTVSADFYLGGACWMVTDGRPNSFWTTQPPQSPGQYTAVMQDDGNFVVYQGPVSDNSPIEPVLTPTNPNPPGLVLMGNNIWASNTQWAGQQTWVASGDRLTTQQWMSNGTALISANGTYAAVFQNNGALVLCHTTNSMPDLSREYWSALSSGHVQVRFPPTGPPFYAVMQSDGNFVVYDGWGPPNQGLPYWATNTSRSQGQFTAVIQNDGNFVVYEGSNPIWASNTAWVSRPIIAIGPDRLGSNQTASWISNDAALISADGRYAAVLRGDGNLALCHTTNSMPDLSREYWSALSSGHVQVRFPPTGPPFYAVMQSDGNFVVYDGTGPGSQGLPYWATNTSRSQGQFTAIMQTDGNFVLYAGTPSGNPSSPGAPAIWASNTTNP